MTGYDDIIHLPHYVSKTRAPMSMHDRAAQFSPFAALTGYDDAIRETGRRTQARIELDEEALTRLNRKLQRLMDRLDEAPTVTLTCFQPDDRKDGGAYVTLTGVVKTIDIPRRVMMLTSGERLALDDVLDMTGDVFAGL